MIAPTPIRPLAHTIRRDHPDGSVTFINPDGLHRGSLPPADRRHETKSNA